MQSYASRRKKLALEREEHRGGGRASPRSTWSLPTTSNVVVLRVGDAWLVGVGKRAPHWFQCLYWSLFVARCVDSVAYMPVAPVAYQVILEPDISQFREFESPRVHARIKSSGLFCLFTNWLAQNARAWVSNTRWKIDEQWDCWIATLCGIKIERKNRGKGTTPGPRLVQKLESWSVGKNEKKIYIYSSICELAYQTTGTCKEKESKNKEENIGRKKMKKKWKEMERNGKEPRGGKSCPGKRKIRAKQDDRTKTKIIRGQKQQSRWQHPTCCIMICHTEDSSEIHMPRNIFQAVWYSDHRSRRLRGVCMPVAPIAYQVILEPFIGHFRKFESPRLHTRINSWGLFLCTNLLTENARAWVSNTRWKIDEQWDCWALCAIKIEGKNRGGEGTTPVTTACPQAGK